MILLVGGIALLASFGQVLLKTGVSQIGAGEQTLLIRLSQALFNPYVFVGLSIYAVCALLWLYVISKLPLSIAYPILGLTFFFVPILGVFFFEETLSLKQGAGLMLLFLGILVFYS